MALPEIHVVAGTTGAAAELAPVAQALRMAGLLVPVLVVAGADPGAVGAAFADLDLVADLTLPAGPAAALLTRFDRMWANRAPSTVLVAGSDPAGLSAALAAFWHHIPVAHLGAGARHEDLPSSSPAPAFPASRDPASPGPASPPVDPEACGRLITQLARVHLVANPIDAMNLLDEGVPARDLMISGDDTLAPRRAAQAVAAVAGLAPRPAPMPVVVPPATARFGG
ncbi:UDP-N-acetylglucosamine 2-epimerase [Actinoplanes sp. NPDC049265]|uniref:UDP-N-acetylglucosamine 2-epimerase n=1 Tax=Actinoplanes sp. NPDC049265 TaxID=3363902 RepID=UPI00371E063D